ncbi:MAG: hypothetical protein AAF531_07720 [Actinomycetota bacterium]
MSAVSAVPPGLLAVRKAAILAHWVPGISLLVSQSGWPGLQVTTTPWDMGDDAWLTVHPCQFRHEVCALPETPSTVVGPTLGTDDSELQIEVVTSGLTRFDDAGLFTVPFDTHHSAVGFSMLSEVPIDLELEAGGTDHRATCQFPIDQQPDLTQNVDIGLGMKLVTCCYPTEDLQRAEAAREAVLELLFTAGADEVAMVAGALR